MRRSLFIFILLIFTFSVQATECVDRVFHENKVVLYLCQNYSNYNETTTLLFKARTKVLNDYINEKIKSGQLKDKKFEIQIYDVALTYKHLDLTQGKKGYFVNLSGFPSLNQLVAIVDYFTKTDWKPFLTSDYQKVSSKIISKKIDRFYDDNIPADFPAINQTSFPIWTLGDLHLDYHNDDLKYFIGTTQLTIEPTSSLPIKIRDRILFFQYDSIFVFHGEEIIKQIKIAQPISADYTIYSFKKWVNISTDSEENWVYSYSYDKNKFYKRDE